MPIQDKAQNALQIADGEGKFIGQESGSSDGFPLEIYSFIDKSIRDLDSAEGKFLLRRYLVGAQVEWEETQGKIKDLRTLRSVSECPDDLLKFLKLTLGWTASTDQLTDGLEPDVLRRLLSQSIPLWRIRGEEGAYLSIINLVFSAVSRIWNWFDLRWILDDGIVTEQHQGRDSYVLDLPGPPNMEENRSNLRIVDDGTGSIDHDLAAAFVRLMRPTGERIGITWLSFLDLFDGDASKWTVDDGPEMTVTNGSAVLSDTDPQAAYATAGEAFQVAGQQGYVRIRKPSGGAPATFGGLFWRQANGDGYLATLDIVANTLTLQKTVSGVVSDISVYDFAVDAEMIHHDTWYGLRWLIENTGAGTEIRLYVDGLQRISVVETPEFYKGSHGFFHAGDSVEVSEIEVMPVPTDTMEIGINS